MDKTSGSKVKEKTGYRPPMESSKLKIKRRFEDLGQSKTSNAKCLKVKADLKTRTSLFDAVNNNDLLAVNGLIQNGTYDVNVQDNSGRIPLHTAVQNSNVEIVRCLIQQTNCDVNLQDNLYYTALHLAVLYDNTEIVRCLVEHVGCDVNIKIGRGDTPLHTAVKKSNINIVRCLTEQTTCNVNIQNSYGEIPLHTAVLNDNIQIVRCFINRAGSNFNLQNSSSQTPLHIAVCYGNIDIVRSIIEEVNCGLNIRDNRGHTPLHIAVQESNIEIVRCIIGKSNCGINIKDNTGRTPLHMAVQESNIEIVRCMIGKSNCGINIKDNTGRTPLHMAVWRKNTKMIRCLTDHSTCDVNIQEDGGFTPLHIAVCESQKEVVECLLNRMDCDVNIQDRVGETPLHSAVRERNMEIVRRILGRNDSDTNIQDKYGCIPLHLALYYGNMQIIKCLIEVGNCDVNIINGRGYSPFSTGDGLHSLHKIAKDQDVELLHDLIQRNVDVLTDNSNAQFRLADTILRESDIQSLWFFIQNGLFINYLTSSGENIVHLLAQCYIDYYIDFSFLFDYKLDFNHTNNDGNSPLMVASLFMNSPFLQFLAPLPCDVNRQNHQGHTALHLCVTGFTLIKEKLNMMKVNSIVKELCAFEYFPRYLQCIGILLSLGADVNMQDKKGKTVLMLACMKNDRKLLETLFIHRADVNIVDNHRRSALQYIDLTNNVYDLTCFNLLLSRGCRQSFNQPCLNGNTLIQNLLQFSPLWQIDQTVNFIKFLVFNNVNLQHLTSDDGEISYGQLSLEEFSSQSRHELRQILVLSGGSVVQITKILHFEQEENYEASLPETLREKPREKFCLFANNLSLKEICRRVIRQNTGLAIHDRFSELLDFPTLTDFLMFKDIDSMRFSLPVQLKSVIDDDYDDDYNSYDLNKENDDYENDYLMYKGLKYLNEVLSYSDSYLDSV